MRTTLALDDELVAEAQRLTGTKERTLLVREALTALIERESAGVADELATAVESEDRASGLLPRARRSA